MEKFDFDAPADVFSHAGRNRKGSPMTYRRFPTGAEAIRHAIEVLDQDVLGGTCVETDDARLCGTEIRSVYDGPDFPLPRRKICGAARAPKSSNQSPRAN